MRITAEFGVKAFDRLQHLPEGETKQRYHQLVLEAADAYEGNDPPPGVDLWPRDYAYAIKVQLAAHDLTGEQRFLDRAQHLADLAIQTFWSPESPLPRASVRSKHYESVTMGDLLLFALLQLHLKQIGQTTDVPLTFID